MKATIKQLNYIAKLMGNTYSAEYDKLTVKTASVLISAIVAYKRTRSLRKRPGRRINVGVRLRKSLPRRNYGVRPYIRKPIIQ